MAPAFFSGALSVGYGFTESQGNGDSAHHRQLARLALGVAPIENFEVSLRLDERYDLHPDDGTGKDDGWVFDPRLGLRLPFRVSDGVALGPDFVAWLPGSESTGTSFEATTLDARLLATFGGPNTHFGVAAGYRLDNSGKAGENADRLAPGDRLALGISDYDAVLAALGFAHDLGGTILKAEVSADVLLGNGAPALMKSPLRAAAGLSQKLARTLALDFMIEGVLSSRPDVGPTEPLIPIEPRVTALIGLRYWLEPPPPPAPPPPPPPPPKPPAPPKPTSVPLELQLIDDDGQPVTDAHVTLEVDGKKLDLTPDGQGGYKLEQAPFGHGKVHAEGEGIQPIDQPVELGPGEPVKVEAKAPVALPSAQVRGLVRSFTGKPVSAKIRVEPLGKEVTTDEKGNFVIDVEPGDYEVVIEAKGYETQRRNVTVEKQGVVVLNADMVKGKK